MTPNTAPRPTPDFEIYDFERQFDDAFAGAFESLQLVTPAKQQDDKILQTPYVRTQFISGQQQQRSYIVPGTVPPGSWSYPNVWEGTLRVGVVTNRKRVEEGKESHSRSRGAVRWIMQDHINQLSSRMKYLQIVQVLEASGQPSFEGKDNLDISELTYKIVFCIKGSAFPTPDN